VADWKVEDLRVALARTLHAGRLRTRPSRIPPLGSDIDEGVGHVLSVDEKAQVLRARPHAARPADEEGPCRDHDPRLQRYGTQRYSLLSTYSRASGPAPAPQWR
jgi:hypothetical protein